MARPWSHWSSGTWKHKTEDRRKKNPIPGGKPYKLVWKQVHGQRIQVKVYPPAGGA